MWGTQAYKIAGNLASGPTETLSMIRQMLWSSMGHSLEEQLAMENRNQIIAGATADATEGRTAFVQKRKAVFRGL